MPEGMVRLPSSVAKYPAQDDGDALAELTRIKDRLDLSSERHAKRRVWLSLVALLLVWGLLAYLTYKLGWGVMEPWTYFIGIASAAGAYGYFAYTQQEFSPRAIYEHMIESKKKQTYLDSGFNLEKYERLTRSKP